MRGAVTYGFDLYRVDAEQVTASLVLEVSRLANLWNPVPALPESSEFVAEASERDIQSLCSVCSVTAVLAQSAKDMSAFDLSQCYSVSHHCTSYGTKFTCRSVGSYG